MPLDILYERVKATYSLVEKDSAENRTEMTGETEANHVDGKESVKSAVNRIIDDSEFKITRALNGEMCVVWPSTKVGNYCQFRAYERLEKCPFQIDYLSIIELKNALKFNYYNDLDSKDIISRTIRMLGYDSSKLELDN